MVWCIGKTAACENRQVGSLNPAESNLLQFWGEAILFRWLEFQGF